MRLILITFFALGLSTPASATDEFGARFSSDAPVALQGGMEDVEKSPEEALSEIAPAAGEEDAQTPESGADAENQDAEASETPETE